MSDDDFIRLFQRTFGLTADGWAGKDTEAKVRKLPALAGVADPRSKRITNIGLSHVWASIAGALWKPFWKPHRAAPSKTAP